MPNLKNVRGKIIVIDFGGQFTQLIATKIRSLQAFSEIWTPEEALKKLDDTVKGVIFSGGPASVYDEGAPTIDAEILHKGIPLLGICYGHQLITQLLGGKVEKATTGEFGKAIFRIEKPIGIFASLPKKSVMWMSHGDETREIPAGFEVVGTTDTCAVAAMADVKRKIFTVQFHPEVIHSEKGLALLAAFVDFCGLKNTWTMADFVAQATSEVRAQVGDKNVFLLVSGGVDSTVVFALLDKILGEKRVFGLFVDTGLLRLNEAEEVEKMLNDTGFHNLHVARESKRFINALKGVFDPEKKREIIGNTFLEVQAAVAAELKLDPVDWFLAQGTIFPDTIETGGSKHSTKIKTHHNRVPQIEKLIEEGRLVEPLKLLFKDEVRAVGRLLGLPEAIVGRHPFPGPGLGVRLLCAEKEDLGAGADKIEQAVKAEYGLESKVLPVRSVGVQGDSRTFAHPLAIFDYKFDYRQLEKAATEIANRHRAVNRVIFCLTRSTAFAEPPRVPHSEITAERIALLQKADFIAQKAIRDAGLTDKIWQFPVVLAPLDFGNGETVILRPIESTDAMTAVAADIPAEILEKIAADIMALGNISAVFYDLTSKPPGTIEWE